MTVRDGSCPSMVGDFGAALVVYGACLPFSTLADYIPNLILFVCSTHNSLDNVDTPNLSAHYAQVASKKLDMTQSIHCLREINILRIFAQAFGGWWILDMHRRG